MQTKQDGRLGTEKIGKLMLELALPSVLAQIVNVLYNIVDRIYIGRIPDVGSLALTGVGVTFPIITIISAFAGFASGGGAPLDRHRTRTEKPGPAQKKFLEAPSSLLLFFSVLSDGVFLFLQTPLLTFLVQAATQSDTLPRIFPFILSEPYLSSWLSD